jgi:hypothetical protein
MAIKKEPKFVQIAATDRGLFALSADGTVWAYITTNPAFWRPLSAERQAKD